MFSTAASRVQFDCPRARGPRQSYRLPPLGRRQRVGGGRLHSRDAGARIELPPSRAFSMRATLPSAVHRLVRRMHCRVSGTVAAALTALLVLALPGSAAAVSTRDLIELAKAGLSDDVLVALIEAAGTEFHLDAPKILELRQAGLSERVIMAMIKNTRPAPSPDASTAAAPPPPAGPPQNDPYFVVIGDKPPE